MLSGHTPPGNAWPQFAEFMSGDPHLPQKIDAQNFTWKDFSTLRWDRSKMDHILNPAAMGQSLMKQYLWAQDMESAFHDSNNSSIDANGTITPDSTGSSHFDASNDVFFGGDSLDGFVGMVLTAEAINKVKFIVNSLAYDGNSLGSVDPATYDPSAGIKYFPHEVKVTETQVDPTMPPKPSSFSVVDGSSHLFDQFSMLWGTLNFTDMMDPNNSSDAAHLAYHSLFDGDPFPAAMSQTGTAGPFDLMKGTSKVIFLNLIAMHYDSNAGTFVDSSSVINGNVTKGAKISTVNAGYIIVALKRMIGEFKGTPIEQKAHDALVSEADFMVNHLQNLDGSFSNSYDLSKGAPSSDAMSVESQAGALRGLYLAYEVTTDSKYLNAANSGYLAMKNRFYLNSLNTFRTSDGSDVATYTPFNFAVITGALREAALIGGQKDAPIIYTRFFKTVANKMQLSEGANTGESGNDSDGDGIPFIPEQPDNLPPVFAAEARLELVVTAISKNQDILPHNFKLNQNYPNPFNPTTKISFTLPASSFVKLDIYNIMGQKIATLVNKRMESGSYTVDFNASHFASGMYIYRIQAGTFTETRKMMLIK